jgi:undecaprenyl-diphosphatase
VSLDDEILRAINRDMASPYMDAVMATFDIIGLTVVWLALVIPLWLRSQKRTALQLLVLIIIVDIVVLVVKLLVTRERPVDVRLVIPQALSYSFPSGHTARAFAGFLLLSMSLRHRHIIPPILFLNALLIAIGRIYLGMHFPSDVLGGAFVGLVLAYGFSRASRTSLFRYLEDWVIRSVDGLVSRLRR